ncbi:MAG: ribosome recycling factor [Coriobacteriia bacterium]|nr:ribosome recycling factor [Coriobacteriia bacterium]
MINEILSTTRDHMDKTHDAMLNEFATVRTGRATPMVLDRVMVEAYGSPMPINQLATIKSTDAHSLVIEPWDKKMLKAVEKAILTSDLGLVPNNDGMLIRISFPTPTEERRIELTKLARNHAEDSRVATRNIRRDANHRLDVLKKNGDASEDDVIRAGKEVQKYTDDAIKRIDESLKAKEAEIMEV